MTLNIALIGIELFFSAALALLLHANSRKYGLAPFLILMSGLVALLQAVSPLHVQVEVLGQGFTVTSVTAVPVILMSLLVLYVVEGTAAARVAILGIISLSLLVLVFQLGLEAHATLPGGRSMMDLPGGNPLFDRSWKITLASIVAFGGSLVTIIIVFQSFSGFPPFLARWFAPGGAILAAVLVDEIIFQLFLHGWAGFQHVIGGNLIGKGTASLLLWIPVAFYLNRFAPRLEGYVGTRERGSWDVVFGSYKTQESILKATRVERRRAEQALESVEVRFRSTFEQVGVGLVHSDEGGRFQRVNQAMCNFLGYSERELLKLTWEGITPPEDRGLTQEAREILTSGASHLVEVDKQYSRKDGTPVWAHVTASLVRDRQGNPDYFVTAVEDLTERMAAEESLRHAQKMEAVGQLTGGIAHDFNNLLTVVMGGLELGMEKDAEAGERDRLLADAYQAAQRGASLTQRLLAFSRKQPLRPVSLSAVSILEEMRELLTRTLGENIRIKIDALGKVGKCLADHAQLENAILNLALNARDAMGSGGTLRITSERVRFLEEELPMPEVQPGEYVRISVIDDGIGIPAENIEKVFDPFFTTKETGKGSGLGLSMVYGFARQSGGFVTVESVPKDGTSIRMHLPAE